VKVAVLALTRALVRLFYRRIEVAGLENLPREGPVLLAANHTNGLVDPMVVLAALPRPVVFVAKSTLWKVPLLRSILDLLGCVPVLRRGEEEKERREDPGISSKGAQAAAADRNEESFQRLAGVLEAGRCVLIFPEGRSHSDPRLSEMRTGTARLILLSKKSPVVLPLGLWFTKKEEFRSDVLVKLGPPVPLPPCPPEAAVEKWTEAIGAALGEEPAQLLAVFAEDVCGPSSGGLDARPRRRILGRAEQHERGLERQRGERVARHADGLAVVHRGDEGDTRRVVAQNRPVRGRVGGQHVLLRVGHRGFGVFGASTTSSPS